MLNGLILLQNFILQCVGYNKMHAQFPCGSIQRNSNCWEMEYNYTWSNSLTQCSTEILLNLHTEGIRQIKRLTKDSMDFQQKPIGLDALLTQHLFPPLEYNGITELRSQRSLSLACKSKISKLILHLIALWVCLYCCNDKS